MWTDARLLPEEEKSNDKIYAQRINHDGTYGLETSLKETVSKADAKLSAYSEDGSVLFLIDMEKGGMAELNRYSVAGEQPATLFRGTLIKGTKRND